MVPVVILNCCSALFRVLGCRAHRLPPPHTHRTSTTTRLAVGLHRLTAERGRGECVCVLPYTATDGPRKSESFFRKSQQNSRTAAVQGAVTRGRGGAATGAASQSSHRNSSAPTTPPCSLPPRRQLLAQFLAGCCAASIDCARGRACACLSACVCYLPSIDSSAFF